jgi:AAA domain (dynein-related subfamily)
MSKSDLNLSRRVNFAETVDIIMNSGDNSVHLTGEPGVGKTAMHKEIIKRTGYKGIYIDGPNTDVGQSGMPIPNHDTRTLDFYPAGNYGLHTNEPLVIMIDEWTKTDDYVRNTLHPLLHERRLGNFELHPDSIVFTTGNMDSDGVGDSAKAHTRNRQTWLTYMKPTAKEWCAWATNNGVAPEVIAWVHEYEHCMMSYMDGGQDKNPYIFNPNDASQIAFVSPRSLVKASHWVTKRDKITENAFIATLDGTIGFSASRDMQAYIELADQLPTREAIETSPDTAIVPNSPAAQCILVFKAVAVATKDNFATWMRYIKRMPKEVQAVFINSLLEVQTKKSWAMTHPTFVTWARENQYMFAGLKG